MTASERSLFSCFSRHRLREEAEVRLYPCMYVLPPFVVSSNKEQVLDGIEATLDEWTRYGIRAVPLRFFIGVCLARHGTSSV